MQHFLSILFMVFPFTTQCYSQDSKHSISFEVGYPIPIGNNVFNNGFGQGQPIVGHDGSNGLWDFGIGYNLTSLGKFGIGAAINVSKFKLEQFGLITTNYRPRINLNYPIKLNELEISPRVGIGYTIQQYTGTVVFLDADGNVIENAPTNDGPSLSAAIRISTTRARKLNYYFQIGYEYTSLFPANETLDDITRSSKLNILFSNLGLTYHF